MTSMRRRLAALTAGGLVLALAACGGPGGASDLGWEEATESPEATPTESSGPAVTPAACDDPLVSYAPEGDLPGPADLPDGSSMAEIRDRGTLIVGVSADTLLMGARNPLTGQIEGFDIDVLREVSRAIFGEDRLQFRVITSAQRIGVLVADEVDIVARTFTITCGRWEEIAFSAPYYLAGQKVLVASDSAAEGIEDLAGQRVCAPEGTTTLTRLESYPAVEAVPAATHGSCLALFQQGAVDAITGDDTILAGFVAQDPHAKVVGDAFSSEPYGLGIAADRVDLVRFVNGVLERMVADGTWEALYTQWLSALGPAPAPPTPTYGRVA